MEIIVEGGNVVCKNPKVKTDGPNKAVVKSIVFTQGIRTADGEIDANGGEIILYTKNPPDYRNFEVGDILDYNDSNANNNRRFKVISEKGPCKYLLE